MTLLLTHILFLLLSLILLLFHSYSHLYPPPPSSSTLRNKNPHPRLWRLLATAALESLDLNMAERSFVRYVHMYVHVCCIALDAPFLTARLLPLFVLCAHVHSLRLCVNLYTY